MEDDTTKFLRIAAEVGPMISKTSDYKSVQPHLLDILDIVLRNPDKSEWFESKFIEMFDDAKNYSEVVIIYCMHVLKYPRVLAHVKTLYERDALRTNDRARRVLDACSPNWLARRIFKFPGDEK